MTKDSFFNQFKSPNKPLIIADLANNHGGSLSLAKEMCEELAEIQKQSGFRIAMKLQYRNLDTFIAPNFKGDHSFSYIKRFEETALSWDDFRRITEYAKELGLLTAATPFDEISIEHVLKHGHDFLKIASASSTDWPLLSKIPGLDIPIVVSTGGLTEKETERVASFFSHAEIDFAIMHCVALYPTDTHNLNLSRISEIRSRFNRPTGYSTHESPDDLLAGPLALAAGATILERHFGKQSASNSVNAYSSERDTLKNWIDVLANSMNYLIDLDTYRSIKRQKETLRKLQRGVRAAEEIPESSELTINNLTFSIPIIDNQLSANEISIRSRFVANSLISKGSEISLNNTNHESFLNVVEEIVQETRELLNGANVALSRDQQLEISHHYGIENFKKIGMAIITQVNREYCKKILVIFPGQTNPEHFHKKKEETFIVLKGELSVVLEGSAHQVGSGQVLVIPRGSKHILSSVEGCVVEEISTQHFANDSYYSDTQINANQSRKTLSSFWV